MATYIGNINELISTSDLLNSLGTGMYEVCHMRNQQGQLKEELLNGVQKENVENWYRAGYPDPICNGTVHCPHFHFDEKFLFAINKKLNIIADRCAISVTLPGQVIAPHTDVDGRELSLSSLGEIKGFHIHLGMTDPGHVFMIENQTFYQQQCGAIYEWDNWHSLHSGANAGLTTRYIMAIRGVRPTTPIDYQYLWDENEVEYLRFQLPDGRVVP